MKKLLYVGHNYHLKTKSTKFLMEMFEENYEVSYVSFDPYKKEYVGIEEARGQEFDVLLVFQIQLTEDFLTRNFRFKQGVFFPMYDSIATNPGNPWREYRHFKIINFSRTLHEMLIKKGYKSYYIQYFPEPFNIKNEGNIKSIFYWQRMEKININVVNKLFENMEIDHIHLHKAMDPMQSFIKPDEETEKKITYSEWFDTADEMRSIMQESAFYIVPRQYEGIGMSFLEAMAMGRCVVAPDYPTMNEYIKDGENGILYNLDDIKPVTIDDVRRIQKNAYNYITNGYNEWTSRKQEILKWIEEKDEKPLVTVVTVVRNAIRDGRQEMLEQCIASVRSQRYPNIEHLVMDGASDDGTTDMLDRYQKLGWLKYYSEPDSGMYEAMNKGIRKANGKYIVFLNTDDYFHNADAIEESVYSLENSKADFSFASNRILKENGVCDTIRRPEIGSFVAQMPFCHQTMFTSKEALVKVGMFNEEYKSSADYDLVLRMILGGYKYVEVESDIVTYRNGGVSESVEQRSNEEKFNIFQKLYAPYYNVSETFAKLLAGRICPIEFCENLIKSVPEKLGNEIRGAIIRTDEENGKYYFPLERMETLGYELKDSTPRSGQVDKYLSIIEKKDARIDKFVKYFGLLDRWLWLKLQNKNIKTYFEKENYHSIAIYGIGEIGNRLFEELTRTSDIEIKYAIDSIDDKLHSVLKVYSQNDELPQVDVIVVTVDYIFEQIKEKLAKKTDCPIISIDNVVFNIE